MSCKAAACQLLVVISLGNMKCSAGCLCFGNTLLLYMVLYTHAYTHVLHAFGPHPSQTISLLLHTHNRMSCSNSPHHTAGGASERSITFKRIAHLPSPVSTVDAKASLQEKRRQLKQQEDQQRNSLEQMLQLHLEASFPSPVQATGIWPSVMSAHCRHQLAEHHGHMQHRNNV